MRRWSSVRGGATAGHMAPRGWGCVTHQKSWSNKKKHARAGHIPCGGEIDGGEPGATIHAIEVVVIDDDGDNDRKRDRRR
jgi:hypothetical protein